MKKEKTPLLDKYKYTSEEVLLSEIVVDEVKPDKGFSKSLGVLGHTTEVILNEFPNLAEGKKYHVIDGRKTINDFIKKERKTIKARVYKNLPVEVARKILLVRNLQRSSSPVVEAESIQAEINSGKTQKEISEVTGVNISVLNQRLSLLKLPKNILDKLRKNEIPYSTAKKIASMPIDVQNRIAKEKKIIGEVVEEHHQKYLNEQVSFDDMELPKEPKGKAKVYNYHFKQGDFEKDMTRKELLSHIESAIAGLSAKEEIIIKRIQ